LKGMLFNMFDLLIIKVKNNSFFDFLICSASSIFTIRNSIFSKLLQLGDR